MAGYLIAEEGPLAGLIIRFEEGEEWILGRDPDEASILLEDPMVSRKHVICRLTPEGYLLENLSAVNPATQNGKVITEAVLLREGDIIQVGSTFFRFTEVNPAEQARKEELPAPSFEEPGDLSSISFAPETRWLLKVISGPNTGAEFNMQKSHVYLLGKDPDLCDIVFQDLSVSRQHARITIDDYENAFIEDLGSRNGVLVNGELTLEKHQLTSQDLVALGTTSFLVIDRHEVRETIVSPAATPSYREEKKGAVEEPTAVKEKVEEIKEKKDWKEMIIPIRHLILAGIFGVLVLIGVVAMFSLFKSSTVVVKEKNETETIKKAIKNYTDVQIAFNPSTGKLFLVGHVLTGIDKQELLYILNSFPFILSIDDKIVVDEYVWQNMNALLATNPDWQGISIHSPSAGHFVMRGYLQTPEQAQSLIDYINRNFPYLARLENQVVVENNLMTQIASMLIAKNFNNVTFQLVDGDLVLSGRVDEKNHENFNEILKEFKLLKGIRSVKNFVIMTTADTSSIDLSDKYQVTGYSKKDESEFYVVINGKILSKGEKLDGMTITAVLPNSVLLEKDGIKFKINYNLQ